MYNIPKKFYVYEIIDIDSGEILKKINNKEFKTIKNEQSTETRGEYLIITNRRIVKHNGQTQLEL